MTSVERPNFNVVRLAAYVFVGATLALCIIPFILVFAISFGEKIEGAAWVWSFDLGNYKRFFVGADWPNSTSFLYLNFLWYSIYYSIIASVLAVATAFPFVYMMTRQARKRQTVWLVFFLSCLTFSEVFVVMGWDILLSNRSGLPALAKSVGLTEWLKETGWLNVLRELGLATPRNIKFKPSGFATILTLVYLVWPYAVILLYPPISKIEKEVVEAARTMGASPYTVLRTIVLPIVKAPVVGSMLLLFVFLLGAYVTITVFSLPSKQTMSVSVYEAVRGGTLNAPFGAAQSILLLFTAALILVCGRKFISATESV